MSRKSYKSQHHSSRNFSRNEGWARQQHHSSHRGKRVKPYALLAYVFTALLVALFACRDYNSYINQKRLEIEAATYAIEMDFGNMLNYSESLLNYINRQILVGKPGSAEIARILGSYGQSHYGYNSVKDVLSVGMFYWIDANKNLVASSAGLITSPIDLSSRDYLINTQKEPWKIFTGAPVIGAVSGQWVIPAAVGVVNGKNEYVGTSVVSFNMSNLVEKFKRLVGFYKTDFAILDESGKVLLESEDAVFSQNQELMQDVKISENSLREELVSNFSPLDRKGSFITIRNFEKFPYKIAVGYRNSILTKELFLELLPHAIALVVILLFAAIRNQNR